MRKHACRARRREGWRGEKGRRQDSGGGHKARGVGLCGRAKQGGLLVNRPFAWTQKVRSCSCRLSTRSRETMSTARQDSTAKLMPKGSELSIQATRGCAGHTRWVEGGDTEWWSGEDPPVAYSVLAMHLFTYFFVPERGSRSRL